MTMPQRKTSPIAAAHLVHLDGASPQVCEVVSSLEEGLAVLIGAARSSLDESIYGTPAGPRHWRPASPPRARRSATWSPRHRSPRRRSRRSHATDPIARAEPPPNRRRITALPHPLPPPEPTPHAPDP